MDENKINDKVYNTKEELVSSVIQDLGNNSNYYQVEDLVNHRVSYITVNKENKGLELVRITVEECKENKGLKVKNVKTDVYKLGNEIEVERFTTKNNIILSREIQFILTSGDITEFEEDLNSIEVNLINHDRNQGVRVSAKKETGRVKKESSVGTIFWVALITIVVSILVVFLVSEFSNKDSEDKVSSEFTLEQKEDLVLEELRKYYTETATVYLDETTYKIVPNTVNLITDSDVKGLSKEVVGILGENYSVGLMNPEDTELILEAKNGKLIE